ncbi:Protein JINGUBANG [Linum grandiflorum]
MASILDSENSPQNPSFAIRETPNHHHPHPAVFLRSLSSKDQLNVPYDNFILSPPRRSSQLETHYSNPLAGFLSSSAQPSFVGHGLLQTKYRCASSVMLKDGQILAIAATNELIYTGSESNVIRVWKLPDFTECGHLKMRGSSSSRVVAIELGHDNKVYGAYGDGKIRVWQRMWREDAVVGGIKHIRIGTIPATGGYLRSYISSAGKDKLMGKHKGPITSLAINMSDNTLYSASLDKTVKVWRIPDLKCIETIQAHPSPINSLVVSDSSDALLYTASDDATIRVWRRNFCSSGTRPHALVVTLSGKQSPVKSLALTSDRSILYGGCSDGYIYFWLKGWLCGQLQYGGALQGHTHSVMTLACCATRYMVSGSADRTCRVWQREVEGRGRCHVCLVVLVGHRGPIRSLVVVPMGLMMKSHGRFDNYGGDQSQVISEDYEDNNTLMVCSGSLDGALKLWRVTKDCSGGKVMGDVM